MYNVRMRKYTVSMVRERLSQALDEALQGEPVFIQRRGIEYRVTVEPSRARARAKKATAPKVEILDRAVAAGQWTWDWSGGELQFKPRRRS